MASPDVTTAPAPLRVICLCAAWCGVCREWTGIFEALSTSYPQVLFDWVDVEDEADAMGDVDIETFPTLLIAQGNRARFLGPVQPSPAQVARLLESLLADPAEGRDAGPEANALLDRLHARVLPKR
jgi:thiol-disulfide isomerase/thioredoxin